MDNKNIIRNFGPTTWALKNRNTIFLLSFIIALFGIVAYKGLPKELFPEVYYPTIMVQTFYPGNPPVDIENLITRPLEKELEDVKGLKKLSSTSLQDASMILVEFNTDVSIPDALQETKDAVDRAKSELPNDLLTDPVVNDIDFSEFPIININLSGDYSIQELKRFAEYLEDEIEAIPEVSKVNIQGVEDREIVIEVDMIKLESLGLSFTDIENAVRFENVSMSGGDIKIGKTRRSIRIIGEFASIKEIEAISVKRDKDKTIYLRDVAKVKDTFKEPTTIARLNGKPVVSVQVVKKSGENLLNATDQIFAILEHAQKSKVLPAQLELTITNDQSDLIRKQLSNLENSMILGVILVVLVLFYFLGTRNALFVGLSIPLSMLLSFVVINLIGYRINMIVLFSLILALGMLVDNAIVVVENIYRFVDNGHKPFEAARLAVGEIAGPVIASTITTLAAFLPLAFWQGLTGEFMKNLPVTLIIVLTSSLAVALVIIPVITATFIKHGDEMHDNIPDKRKAYRASSIIGAFAVVFYLTKVFILANILAILAIIIFLNAIFFYKVERWFRYRFLTWLERAYTKVLTFSLVGKRPFWITLGTFFLLIFTIIFFAIRSPEIKFFPSSDPNYINVIAELPIGSDLAATDSVMMMIENDINRVLAPNKEIVKSVLTTVGKGDPEKWALAGSQFNKGLTTITFVDYKDRGGVNTSKIMRQLNEELLNKYPGVKISIAQNQMGPPAGKAINIEVSGQDFETLISSADSIISYINSNNIDGIEGLKLDIELGKPELIVKIDRDKARRFGLSTMQIASTIRTAIYGKEISKFKDGEDDYSIQLRYADKYRYSLADIMNQKIGFMENGQLVQIPLSAVADFEYSNTYGSVMRKDKKRVVTIYSNVVKGYNATSINNQLKLLLSDFNLPEGYSISFTGEQEEQQKSMEFLSRAMLIALSLILLILVTQFNSLIRPLIIMTSVLFSTIGVFGGIATFKMDFVVVMTGIGLVSLAGIVVNNAIVLIDYIGLLKERRRVELGLAENDFLPMKYATDCIITAGKTRLRPVLLTAITTILGLIPMAIGMNFDFYGALSRFKPDLYFGGDNVIFWGPISWTVIFGLTFSTFLTLIIVPVMYRVTVTLQKKFAEWTGQAKRIH
ncbi:efflux RND transporter permease subunit [Tenuifilum thalassicum]|uniref:Efflux RND transporter permease subunit n=1 Tax=Tenuifilum thalassicum TaxID=2590900 RepID=A0A7D3XF92_9BACT|nr:efflux RND transporter permease subunit [Tenuifilum thalassicum]QKG79297.1 efflux RND transporter permease subunit [Tenuifilum thalassicum]